MSNRVNDDDLYPPDLTQEEWLDALITPVSEVGQAWAEQNFKADIRNLESGLRNPHQEGQRLYGEVVFDLRVNDSLLLECEINDENTYGRRYELPQQDCKELSLRPKMRVSGVVSFSLTSHWKGINHKGEPAWLPGAIVPGSVRIEPD